jgi:hypothetical protein
MFLGFLAIHYGAKSYGQIGQRMKENQNTWGVLILILFIILNPKKAHPPKTLKNPRHH